jgi:type II secretory pathway pseudopilin PulG
MPTRLILRSGRAFSLVEVVIALGIFAVAVIAILALLLPNTQKVEDLMDADVSRRLSENIQSELQRYSRVIAEGNKGSARKGFDVFDDTFYNGATPNRSVFMVATRDGQRVLVTGEDPYFAWNFTYSKTYKPDATTVQATTKLSAENNLNTGNPLGIALRDRYFLIEVFLPTSPAYRKFQDTVNTGLGFLPLGVRVVWPYRLPDGPAISPTPDEFDKDVSVVIAPARHTVYNFNLALTP